MNMFKLFCFIFLFFVVEANFFFNKNYFKTVYNKDSQCEIAKKMAYHGNFFSSNFFNLYNFFSNLKSNNCTYSLLYECRTQNFKLFSKYTQNLYQFFCDETAFLNTCYDSVRKWAKVKKQTIRNSYDLETSITDINKLLQEEDDTCIIILEKASRKFNFSEIKSFFFFYTNWSMVYNATKEKVVER